jgi:hypothetical protein
MLTWVNSTGGPLICGESAGLAAWKGISGSSEGDGAQPDYERACKTTAYLEAIAVGGATALILGDAPMQSTFVAVAADKLRIARWIAAPSDEASEVLLRGPDTGLVGAGPPVQFDITGQELYMFDSSASWRQGKTEAAVSLVQPGTYIVTTEKLTSPDKMAFIIHRFLPR